ncbi:MAG: type IV pilus biogenesis protein PilP [Paraburkholderia sp.]|jgi:type IV pilus biogenesis protein PilP|uniref:type IV pilus biogenesis protein PilP n=1 Tax=Burkholderiaceae TaxID=119060 RepID=UPI0010F848B1|nr:type IV pilus biogenesis protein PilP [Burkholderia sp. 4M9327F10]
MQTDPSRLSTLSTARAVSAVPMVSMVPMTSRLRLAVLAAALMCVAGAHAVEPVQAANAPPAEAANGAWTSNAAAELTRLQEQTVLLKAEIKKLDAQAEVAQRTAALTRLGSAGTAVDAGSDAVRVVAIEGLGRRFSATLQSAEGEEFDVSAGDVLPNGLHIVSIAPNEVVGRWNDGRTLHLMPVLASRSGAVLNPGVPSAGNMGAAPGMAGGVSLPNGVPGLPSGFPRTQ